MTLRADLLHERFAAVAPTADDADWPDVLVRAGVARRRPTRRVVVVAVAAFALGLAAASVVVVRLHAAQAAPPPGPRRVERHVGNGTVRWLFAHEPRGQSLAEADIPLLSTVGAHWQPVRFARVITPDPTAKAKVVLSLIGKRGRNICMTVVLRYSGGGGCAVGLLLKPFNYETLISTGGGAAVIAGVASDDVARMELFLPRGSHRPVPLVDNVFIFTLPVSTDAVSLVAYDRRGLVIGRSVRTPLRRLG